MTDVPSLPLRITNTDDTLDDRSMTSNTKTTQSTSDNVSAKIVLLSVNDVYDMIPNEHGHGGIAEFATLLEHEKALLPKDVTLLVTLNGDFLSGSEMAERFKGCVN